MANVIAELLVSVGADISGLQTGMSRVTATIENAGRAATRVGGTLSAGITAPLAGIGIAAVAAASDFQSNMNTFQAVSDATGVEMAKLQQLAMDLGEDMTLPGTSAADAAEAMTELSKAGLNVESTMGAVEGVLRLSAAAEIGNAEAAEIAANALNAFNLKGEDANRVADLLAASANASAADIGEMAAAMKMGATVFAAANIPIEDMVTNISLMANAGIKGSDAGTSLKTMLMSLQSPTKKAAETMAALGISIYDAQGNMLPMQNLVGQFSTKLAGLTQQQRNTALATIFGTDAVRAANVVLMSGSEAWGNMKDAVTQAGAAQELSAVKMQGVGGALEGLKSTIESVLTSAAMPFLGTIEGIIRQAGEWISKIGEINPNLIAMGAAIGVAVAVIGPLALGIGAIATVLGAILSPIGLVIAGIVALGVAWATNFGGIRTTTEQIFTAVQSTIQGVIDTVWPYIESFVSTVTGWFEENWPAIQSTVETVFNAISTVVNTVVGEVSGFIQQEFGLIISWVQENWPLIQRTIETVLNTIWSFISGIVADIQRLWSQHGENIMRVITTVWENIKTAIDSAIKIVLGIIKAVMQAINGDWEGAWETIKTTFETVWTNIKTSLGKTIGLIREIIENVMKKISDWISEKLQEIKKWFTDRWNEILAFLRSIDLVQIGKDIIQGLVDGIISMAQAVIASVVGVVNDAIEAAKRLLGIKSPSRVTAREIGAPLIEGIIVGARDAAPDATKAIADIVRDIVEAAVPVVDLMRDAVDTINAMQTVKLVNMAPIVAYIADRIIGMVNQLRRVASYLGTQGIAAAAAFATAAGPVLDAMGSAVDTINAVQTVKLVNVAPIVAYIADRIVGMVDQLRRVAGYLSTQGVAAAAAFAIAAGPVLVAMESAVGTINAVQTVKLVDVGPVVAYIADRIVGMVDQLRRVAGYLSTQGVAAAAAFATAAGPVVGFVRTAVDALKALLELPEDIRDVKPAIDRLGAVITQIATAIVAAARRFTGPAMDAAKAFAEKAGPVVGIVRGGVDAFLALLEMPNVAAKIEPGVAQLAYFVEQLALAISDVAQRIDAKLMTAASEFATKAGAVVGLVTQAVSAINALGDLKSPRMENTNAGLDLLALFVEQVAIKIGEVAQRIDTKLVQAASEFAAAVGQPLSLIRQAVDTFNAIAEFRIYTGVFDKLDTIISHIWNVLRKIGNLRDAFTSDVMADVKFIVEHAVPAMRAIHDAMTMLKNIGQIDLSSLAVVAYNAGVNWIHALADGIRSGISYLESALQAVANLFPHSPAKEGPLSKPVDWEAYLLGNLGDAASQVAMALAPVGTRGMLGPAPANNQALSYQVVINNPTGRPAEDSLRRELAYLSRGISWA